MKKLLELLNILTIEKKKGYVDLDDWKWNDLDHLVNMGFDFNGDYTMKLDNPKIEIYKKKLPSGEYFYLDDDEKGIKIFKNFEDLISYFDHYSQPEIDKQLK